MAFWLGPTTFPLFFILFTASIETVCEFLWFLQINLVYFCRFYENADALILSTSFKYFFIGSLSICWWSGIPGRRQIHNKLVGKWRPLAADYRLNTYALSPSFSLPTTTTVRNGLSVDVLNLPIASSPASVLQRNQNASLISKRPSPMITGVAQLPCSDFFFFQMSNIGSPDMAMKPTLQEFRWEIEFQIGSVKIKSKFICQKHNQSCNNVVQPMEVHLTNDIIVLL